MNLEQLINRATNKARFIETRDYLDFCRDYLQFVLDGLQAIIVSRNETHYRFYNINKMEITTSLVRSTAI